MHIADQTLMPTLMPLSPKHRCLRLSASIVATCLLLVTTPLAAQTRADARLNAQFAEAAQSEAMLRLLMRKLPKGADLHNHSTGGMYAEDMIRWAAEKDGCLLITTMSLAAGPCAGPDKVPLRGLELSDATLYNDAIDAMSMGRHVPIVGDPEVSGHERFFASFGKFGFGTNGERARVLAASMEHAAYDNNLYLELMSGAATGNDLNPVITAETWNEADMAGRFDRMQAALSDAVAFAKTDTNTTEQALAAINRCDTALPAPACRVTLRYLLSVTREAAPELVFGRLAFNFMLVAADPRYVGINIVSPEDGPISLRDYSLHMRMFAFFKTRYPATKLTLHAGELTLGLTPPADLRFHIREAVEVAGANRIGHGVDIAYEDNAVELLARMAREHIAVEINLTSNDVILGVTGNEHPLNLYRAAGVPVALSTDDAGVSRIDLTTEYMRAFTEQGLHYTDLRQVSRNGLTYSFLAGASLWDDSGTRYSAVCSGLPKKPSSACTTLLTTSDKAREQWRLEQAFAAFEAELPTLLKAIPPAAFGR